jgi:hypothetical protein
MANVNTFATRPPVAPNLPIAPQEYSLVYQDQIYNVLRLYFNQIDTFAQLTIQQNDSQQVMIWMDM